MRVGESIVWVITLFLLGSLGVLIIMHPQGFATAAGAGFKGFNLWGKTLSGSGYKGG